MSKIQKFDQFNEAKAELHGLKNAERKAIYKFFNSKKPFSGEKYMVRTEYDEVEVYVTQQISNNAYKFETDTNDSGIFIKGDGIYSDHEEFPSEYKQFK